jgi:hypothetical protein
MASCSVQKQEGRKQPWVVGGGRDKAQEVKAIANIGEQWARRNPISTRGVKGSQILRQGDVPVPPLTVRGRLGQEEGQGESGHREKGKMSRWKDEINNKIRDGLLERPTRELARSVAAPWLGSRVERER